MEILKILNDLFTYIKNFIAKLFENPYGAFSSMFNNLTTFFGETIFKHFKYLINEIFNGEYYKYYVSLLLISILVLIYVIVYYINPFNIAKTKYSLLTILLSGSFLFFIFHFLAYRNFYKNVSPSYDTSNYSNAKNNFLTSHHSNKKFDFNNFNNTLKNPLIKLFKYILKTLGLIIFPIILIIILFWSYNNYHNLYYITQILLGFCIIITILAIIAYIFKITTNKDDINNIVDNFDSTNDKDKIFRKILILIKQIIFSIPCLLVILVNEIKEDIKLTPPSVYILFFILLVLICLVFILPVIFKYLNIFSRNDLLRGNGPYYLNEYREIGSYQNLDKNYKKSYFKDKKYSLFDINSNNDYNITARVNSSTKNVNKNKYNYSYSISFYLYLNPQPKNTNIGYNKETELFNYGNKPVILYDGNTRNLVIKSKTRDNEGIQLDTIYKTKDIKYQKWLNFVINYDNNVIDVFIDGKLVGSKKNVAPYFENDKVTIGEDNGIHGSIKEIYYFNTPRPENNIEFLYDLTKNSTPTNTQANINKSLDKTIDTIRDNIL